MFKLQGLITVKLLVKLYHALYWLATSSCWRHQLLFEHYHRDILFIYHVTCLQRSSIYKDVTYLSRLCSLHFFTRAVVTRLHFLWDALLIRWPISNAPSICYNAVPIIGQSWDRRFSFFIKPSCSTLTCFIQSLSCYKDQDYI